MKFDQKYALFLRCHSVLKPYKKQKNNTKMCINMYNDDGDAPQQKTVESFKFFFLHPKKSCSIRKYHSIRKWP